MRPEGIVHIVYTKAHNEGQPKRQPNEYDIGGYLNQPLLPARQPK
jgi:hypothetical protein